MTLSKSNMIYRFITRYGIVPSTNLCNLFWQVVFMSIGLTIAGVIAGLYIFGPLVMYFDLMFSLPYRFAVAIFLVGTFTAAVIGGVYGVAYLFKDSKFPTLRKAGYFASDVYDGIRDKYCPLIKWL